MYSIEQEITRYLAKTQDIEDVRLNNKTSTIKKVLILIFVYNRSTALYNQMCNQPICHLYDNSLIIIKTNTAEKVYTVEK